LEGVGVWELSWSVPDEKAGENTSSLGTKCLGDARAIKEPRIRQPAAGHHDLCGCSSVRSGAALGWICGLMTLVC
jgi:hypothetical protein